MVQAKVATHVRIIILGHTMISVEFQSIVRALPQGLTSKIAGRYGLRNQLAFF